MTIQPKIILASQSPRRKQLLEWAEIDFEVMVSETDESYPQGLSFADTAIFIAREKARVVANTVAETAVIIAADTIVVCTNEILGKPKDRNDAIRMITMLSAKTHEVITGVCIRHADKEICFSDATLVEFHPLEFPKIEFYVDKYKPFDKAGAYAIQEWIGVVGIKKITGDFYNVMGLPVSRVVHTLKEFTS